MNDIEKAWEKYKNVKQLLLSMDLDLREIGDILKERKSNKKGVPSEIFCIECEKIRCSYECTILSNGSYICRYEDL